MTVQELTDKIDQYKEMLRKKEKKVVFMSETGPVGIGIISDIVATLQLMQSQIDKLKQNGPTNC